MSESRADAAEVIVIGAGAAGLAAAAALRGRGVAVVVFEASAGIGGRIRSLRSGSGRWWEMGAQVVHGRRNPVWGWVDPGEDFRDGEFSLLLGGRAHALRDAPVADPPPWALSARLAFATGAAGDRTVAEWLRWECGPDTDPAAKWLAQEWGAEPGDLDLAETAVQARRHRAAQDQRVPRGGFSSLATALGAGVDVRCDTPVRAVAVEDGCVRVVTGSGEHRVSAAVLTVPPWVVSRGGLRLAGVPAATLAAGAALACADAVVALLETDEPAPRTVTVFDADGSAGFVRSIAGETAVHLVSKGPGARALRGVLANPAMLVERLAVAMPWLRGTRPRHMHVTDWGADPWTGGAFTIPGRGAAAARRTWGHGAGRLAIAGESTCGPGGVARVHGAVASGLSAAGAVLNVVRPTGASVKETGT